MEVLIEQSRLEAPPSLGANRLATGWRPASAGAGLVPAGPRQTIEVVNPEKRPRRLQLRFAEPPAGPADGAAAQEPATVSVLVQGTKIAEAPLARHVELELPPGLAPRRHVLDLRFSGPGLPNQAFSGPAVSGSAASREVPTLLAARLLPSLPAGEVTIEAGSIVQGATSAVEIVHREPLPGRLSLALEGKPRAGQVFEAWLEDARGRERLARFEPGKRVQPIVADVEAGAFVLTLLARGDGPAARWLDPRWRPRQAGDESDDGGPVGPKPAQEKTEGPVVEASTKRPQLVLVYVLDALRADALEQLEARGDDPFITRLGRAGRVFEQHRSVAPNTLPATASLFYGRLFEKTLEPRDVEAPGGEPLAEIFRRAGYRTALFSSNVYVTGEFYMDRGFDYVAPRIDSAVVGENLASEIVTDAALAWLAEQDPAQEHFLYLHVINPHNPYTPPPSHRSHPESSADTPLLVEIREGRLRPGPAQVEDIRRAYLDSVAYADAVLETFIEQLSQRYAEGEMAVVVTSDHGEELLEHGGILHGHSLYEEALRIPLVLWPQRLFGTGRVERPTTTLDAHRLLLALAEQRAPWLEPGLDHLIVTSASSVPRGVLGVQRGRWKVVLTGTRAAEWGMGYGPARTWDTEYVFDLAVGESQNQLGREDLEARWLRAFARHLAAAQGSGSELFTDFDPETAEKLRSLGYL